MSAEAETIIKAELKNCDLLQHQDCNKNDTETNLISVPIKKRKNYHPNMSDSQKLKKCEEVDITKQEHPDGHRTRVNEINTDAEDQVLMDDVKIIKEINSNEKEKLDSEVKKENSFVNQDQGLYIKKNSAFTSPVRKASSSKNDTQSPKCFNCPTCHKSFYSKCLLDTHLILHTDEYKCEFCMKTFEKESSLEKHITTHTRSRDQDFICMLCRKTGIKTRMCDECTNSLTDLNNYKKPD